MLIPRNTRTAVQTGLRRYAMVYDRDDTGPRQLAARDMPGRLCLLLEGIEAESEGTLMVVVSPAPYHQVGVSRFLPEYQ